MSNSIAVIGHNQPPEPTPFEVAKATIDDLYAEAKQWLDGEKVTTQEQANALNTLEGHIRKAAKVAEEARKMEAKPFDDGKADVQKRYKPVLAMTDNALDAVKAALKPYLIELDRIQQEAAKTAREEAVRKQHEAELAIRNRDAANLEERENAERLVAESKQAEIDASKAENVKAHAKGEGRATGLRTVHRPIMTNPRDAAAWVWNERRTELMDFIHGLADKAVRAGARSIGGFDIIEEKVL